MAKQKSRKKKEQPDKIDQITDKTPGAIMGILKKDSIQVALGIILIMFSIYLVCTFTSYLFTGGSDQSVIEHPTDAALANVNGEIANQGGAKGATIAYFWMNDCFGLASYFLPVLLIAIGLRLISVFKINLASWFISTVLFTVWFSIALAQFMTPFFADSFILPGGMHGIYMSDWLRQQTGTPGLLIILATTALLYMIYASHKTIFLIRKALNPMAFLKPDPKLEINVPSEEDETTAESQETVIPTEDQPSETIELSTIPDGEVIDNQNEDADSSGKAAEAMREQVVIDSLKADMGPGSPSPTPPAKKKLLPTDPEFIAQTAKEEEKAQKIIPPYNPRLDLETYKFPTIDLLKDFGSQKVNIDMDEQNSNKNKIIRVLRSFGVEITSINATVGPTITLYEITPAEGVKIAKIRNLEDDIALSLSALGIRIIAPIPGKGTIGIEVPNRKAQIVPMRDIIGSKKFQECKYELPIAFGKTITNEVFMVDLAKAPHMLVAGATGMGKSVGLNAIVTSLLYKKHPSELKFVIVDPKKVEFGIYAPIDKHYLAKLPDEEDAIITKSAMVVRTLKSLCQEMDTRYDLLKKAMVRNIKEYNEKFINRKLNPELGHHFMPYIVVIIDEYGDLMITAGKEVETPIVRLAQLARAVGIHCIIATQRPTAAIVTGNIKANFPARVAFRVAAMVDSRTILDRSGAQQLIGRGDMLYLQSGEPTRVQCAFVDTPEVEDICNYIARQQSYPTCFLLPEVAEDSEDGQAKGEMSVKEIDPMFREAASLIVTYQQGSTSLIQRKLSIGYNRAGRLMDQLERAGIVGASNGAKAREVLISNEQSLEDIFQNLGVH